MEPRHLSISYREQRREAHTRAEQKRRNAIKNGYDELEKLVPSCQKTDDSGYKLNKATILQQTNAHIQELQHLRQLEEEERNQLRKEKRALQIMQTNYDQIIKAHQLESGHAMMLPLTEEDKFSVFQTFMDQLFISFSSIPVEDFPTKISELYFSELSSGVFSWVEKYCKPQVLKEVINRVIGEHYSQMKL